MGSARARASAAARVSSQTALRGRCNISGRATTSNAKSEVQDDRKQRKFLEGSNHDHPAESIHRNPALRADCNQPVLFVCTFGTGYLEGGGLTAPFTLRQKGIRKNEQFCKDRSVSWPGATRARLRPNSKSGAQWRPCFPFVWGRVPR